MSDSSVPGDDALPYHLQHALDRAGYLAELEQATDAMTVELAKMGIDATPLTIPVVIDEKLDALFALLDGDEELVEAKIRAHEKIAAILRRAKGELARAKLGIR